MKSGASVKKRSRNWDQNLFLAAVIIPYLILTLAFQFGPMVFSIVLSFFDWPIVRAPTFAGISNYIRLFTVDTLFYQAVRNTLLYALMNVPLAVGIALFFAILLERAKWLKTVFRTGFFLPVITSLVAVSVLWKWLYNPSFGLFNSVLRSFGISGLNWLTSPNLALVSVMIMSVWKHLGLRIVIFMAALQGIPESCKEAARIDGANTWQVSRYITIPLMAPAIVFASVTTMIGCLSVFEQVYVMTNGGPLGATTTIVYHLYTRAFENFQMGYASTIGVILLVIILLMTLLQMKAVKIDYDIM